eukprot:g18147.t1
MAKAEGDTIIKKYANRRLYNTGTSTYVTLEDLAKMVKKGEQFVVQDAKTGEDITHSVLTQIIFEQESKTGNTLLPISFLRQLISFYGDQMQMVVPTFLEQSMHAFTEQQVQMREQAVVNPRCQRQDVVQNSAMSKNLPAFETRLKQAAADVEAALVDVLSGALQPDEIARPDHLLAAMRHGTLNGGKRLRPFLVIESAALFGAWREIALRVGTALECVHCYSLIHDDLPAMDDDDLRRGQPTVHRAFDEATAILAGDSLLTYAFEMIADPRTQIAADRKITLISALARAAGVGGMTGGQALDLAAEQKSLAEEQIRTLQAMKTGALLRFACEAGPIIAGASDDDRMRLRTFGERIGLAFQLADDLLDVTSDTASLGKATGKDAGRGKGTLVGLHGAEWAEKTLTELISEAVDLLAPYGAKAAILQDAARFVATRRN